MKSAPTPFGPPSLCADSQRHLRAHPVESNRQFDQRPEGHVTASPAADPARSRFRNWPLHPRRSSKGGLDNSSPLNSQVARPTYDLGKGVLAQCPGSCARIMLNRRAMQPTPGQRQRRAFGRARGETISCPIRTKGRLRHLRPRLFDHTALAARPSAWTEDGLPHHIHRRNHRARASGRRGRGGVMIQINPFHGCIFFSRAGPNWRKLTKSDRLPHPSVVHDRKQVRHRRTWGQIVLDHVRQAGLVQGTHRHGAEALPTAGWSAIARGCPMNRQTPLPLCAWHPPFHRRRPEPPPRESRTAGRARR